MVSKTPVIFKAFVAMQCRHLLTDNIFCFYFNLNLNYNKHLNFIMKTNPKLSIVIPVYNEKDTIDEIVRRVQSVEYMNYQYSICRRDYTEGRKTGREDGVVVLYCINKI